MSSNTASDKSTNGGEESERGERLVDADRENELRVAVVNQNSTPDTDQNLDKMARYMYEASELKADLIVFPENAAMLCPSDVKVAESEPIEGTQVLTCCACAKANDIGVLLGSFSEMSEDPNKVYNTSVLIGRDGKRIGAYRKIHLFDVEVSEDTVFSESDTTCPGPAEPVVLDYEGWRLGLSVCYDVRFPELYRAMSDEGVDVMMVPSAFTFRTGSAHWETLLRARAIENQAYVVAPAQTGVCYGERESWGHSMVVDPWGVIVGQAGQEPEMFVVTLKRTRINEVRARIPALSNRQL